MHSNSLLLGHLNLNAHSDVNFVAFFRSPRPSGPFVQPKEMRFWMFTWHSVARLLARGMCTSAIPPGSSMPSLRPRSRTSYCCFPTPLVNKSDARAGHWKSVPFKWSFVWVGGQEYLSVESDNHKHCTAGNLHIDVSFCFLHLKHTKRHAPTRFCTPNQSGVCDRAA